MDRIIISRDIFRVQDEQLWVSSVDVAAYYGRRHKNLLRAIDNKLERLPELKEYVKLSYYKDKCNKRQRCYLIHKEHISKFKAYGSEKRNRIESEYTEALQDKVGGVREVNTDFGSIDLITDSSIYEVKKFSQYKMALGQLLAYGSLYPNHKLLVGFFDINNVEEEFVNKVVSLFNANNIDVLFLEEKKDIVLNMVRVWSFKK